MFGKWANNYYYGKSGKGDYRKEDLPEGCGTAAPGEFPYTRGNSCSNNWLIRQSIDVPTAEEANAKAKKMIEEVGLLDHLNNFPAELSGGEQQRISIARALAKNPKLLLCDEPTGALDYQTGKAILKLLQTLCREKKMTVVIITHNSALTAMADRVIKLKNGKVSSVTLNEKPIPVEDIEW